MQNKKSVVAYDFRFFVYRENWVGSEVIKIRKILSKVSLQSPNKPIFTPFRTHILNSTTNFTKTSPDRKISAKMAKIQLEKTYSSSRSTNTVG